MTVDPLAIRSAADNKQPWQRRPFLRGSAFHMRRMNRIFERLKTDDRDYFLCPPIIVNSFPHTSARLLFRLACAFPGLRNYGSFISSLPTIPFRERTDIAHDRLIRRIVPGEVIGAHLFFNDGNARRICARNGVHFFLYRDLRDVAIVEAHDLTYVKFWHRLHPFFAGLNNDEERVAAAIQGFPHAAFPYNYPNIAQRFMRYKGWLNRYDVMMIRYEDLYSDRFEDIVRKMAGFYSDRCRSSVDENVLINRARIILETEPACTLRGVPLGGWAHTFTRKHHCVFEEIAGDLNRRLGYGNADQSPRDIAGNDNIECATNTSDVIFLKSGRRAAPRR